jgi:hypothetical protein
VEIYNVLGEQVFTFTPFHTDIGGLPRSKGGGASVSFPVNLSAEPSGVYCYRVRADDGSLTGTGKFIIEKLKLNEKRNKKNEE